MPGKRVVMVSVWADPETGTTASVDRMRKDGKIGVCHAFDAPPAAIERLATHLYQSGGGRFRPFLSECPGWVWQR